MSATNNSTFRSWRFIQLSKGCEQHFTSNKVTTSRYTLGSLLPKNLFEQFHRRANLWFLLVAILQLSPVNVDADTEWSTFAPLLFLLLMTLAKDAYLDLKRHKNDNELNSQTYSVWNGIDFVQTASKDIRVGDYLFLQDRMTVPADILILASGHVDHICYVDKQNFIGSHNLATKSAIKETQQVINTLSSEEATSMIPRLRGNIKVAEPNPDFHLFEAYIKMPRSPKSVPLTTDNLVLRQSVIHATPWIIGLVVYTGLETKCYLNTTASKKKISRIERRISFWVTAILALLLSIVLLLALLNRFHSEVDDTFLSSFVNFLLLLHNVIPITLFLTMDIVRLCQVYFIKVDVQLQGRVDIKSGDVNEELGQVEYIFMNRSAVIATDRAELSVIVIGEEEFWKRPDESASREPLLTPSKYRQPSRDFDREGEMISTETHLHIFSEEAKTLIAEPQPVVQSFQRLFEVCTTFRPANFEDFFECVALCNNVVAMENGIYFSPWREDELLAQCARDFGCVLESRNEGECYVNVFGRPSVYEVIAFSEFKKSKLTRILLQPTDEETGVYYVKGPLGAMANILDSTMAEYQRIEKITVGLNKRGIRTQILAKKMILEDTLQQVKKKFQAAKLAVAHVNSKVEAVFREIEDQQEAIFLGIVGVSEQVTSETKDVVQNCQRSGVKLWLMSGDTESVTLAAGYEMGMLDRDVDVLHLKSITIEETLMQELERSIRQFILQDEDYLAFSHNNSYISDDGGFHEVRTLTNGYNVLRRLQGSIVRPSSSLSHIAYDASKVRYCLSIDGATFTTAMHHRECRQLLSYLLFCANAVCCNTFLPLQKSIAVKLVKENFAFRPVTMAIGRSGSAISMLQEADVGVGIQGRDKYANHASDIIIERFPLVSPLIFKHGQWNYMRMAKAVLIFFYRSVILIVILLWFSLMTEISVLSLLHVQQIISFLFVFTLFPIVHVAVLDQHITVEEVPKVPSAYQEGQFERKLCLFQMLKYFAIALVQGLILCGFLTPAVLPVINSHGDTETRDVILVLALILLTVVTNVQVAVDTNHFTWLFVAVFFTSNLLMWVYLVAVNFATDYDLFGVLREVFISPGLITVLVMGPSACFVVAYGVHSYEKVFNPTIVEKLRTGKILPQLTAMQHSNPRLECYSSSLEDVYKQTTLLESSPEDDAYTIRPISLRFVSKYIESEFREKHIKSHLPQIRGTILSGVLVAVVWVCIDGPTHHSEDWYIALRVSLCVLLMLFVWVTYWRWFTVYYEYISFAVMAVFVVAVFVAQMMLNDVGGVAVLLIPILTFVMASINFLWTVALNITNIAFFVIWASYYYAGFDLEEVAMLCTAHLALLISVTIVSAHVGYMLQRTDRLGYKLRFSTEKEVEKSRHILSLLLPAFVLNKVIHREDDRYIAEDQGQVTIIFCDIYDFDTICELYKPPELTAFLDEVFQQFDDLCPVNGIVKIETVGKTYMACAGLKYIDTELPHELSSISHARRAVDFAFNILRTIGSIRLKNGSLLQMKIGINSGPVISGVVGKHKPQFSLVGDAVNTASRMCSTIDTVNTIQISEETKELMVEQHGCVFEPRVVWAKGKGDMNTYLVSEERNDEGKAQRGRATMAKRPVVSKITSSVFSKPQQSATRTETLAISPSPLNDEPMSFSFWPIYSPDDTDEQRLFRAEVLNQSHTFFRATLFVSAVMNLILAAVRILQYYSDDESVRIETVVAYFVLAGGMLACALVPKRVWLNRVSALLGMLVYWCFAVLTLFDIIFRTNYDNDLVAMNIIFQQLIVSWCGIYFVKPLALLSGVVLAIWLGLTTHSRDQHFHVVYCLFILLASIVNCWSIYLRERQLKSYFRMKKLEEREIENNEKLLSQMMPRVVYEKLKQDILGTDRHRSITLIFADIVGFTNWSSDKQPQEVVGMLSALFTQFDMLCVEFKVYKVHTIGDCYVVMGYNGETERRDPTMECLRVLCMAYSMIKVIQEVNAREHISLNMRIGVHTGDVIAGITGKDVVRYDIYGPAVLVANKMESNGTPGKVNVSVVTKELLERVAHEVLEYEENKEIEAKGIGKKYMSYFVKVLDPQRLFELITEE